MWLQIDGWNLTVCCSKSSGRRWASVVLVQRLMEWRRQCYQTIERIKIWHVLNSFWHLWKLVNENLSNTMLSHDTMIVLRVAQSTHIHSAFVSWSCFCCCKIQNQWSTKNLPWLLCSVNHSSILWSNSRYFDVKHAIVFRFADNLISPLKRFAWYFLQQRTMDSLMPYSLAISELFSAVSAGLVTFKVSLFASN